MSIYVQVELSGGMYIPRGTRNMAPVARTRLVLWTFKLTAPSMT